MDIDDVITGGLKELIKSEVRKAINVGFRLSKTASLVEGLLDEDLEILKKNYTEEGLERILNTIDISLNENIPAFDRLCWCKHCEGVLDCTSDHK